MLKLKQKTVRGAECVADKNSVFSFKELFGFVSSIYNQRRCLSPADRSTCLQIETLSYFAIPFAKSYIGVPSFQPSFLKSDLYITVPPRSSGKTEHAVLFVLPASFPNAKV